MTQSMSFDQFKEANDATSTPIAPRKLDSKGRMYATGKRKTSIARVWIMQGRGDFLINGKSKEQYFQLESFWMTALKAFQVANCVGHYDVWCTVKGGGLSGQSGAVRHGISVALQLFNPEMRDVLKAAGLLTRDSRKVERKKPGLRKARRRSQFSKR